MNYPKEVQECVNFLNEYKENAKLEKFHVLHMYPKGLAYPNGYYESRFFDFVLFNTEAMEKRTAGEIVLY